MNHQSGGNHGLHSKVDYYAPEGECQCRCLLAFEIRWAIYIFNRAYVIVTHSNYTYSERMVGGPYSEMLILNTYLPTM